GVIEHAVADLRPNAGFVKQTGEQEGTLAALAGPDGQVIREPRAAGAPELLRAAPGLGGARKPLLHECDELFDPVKRRQGGPAARHRARRLDAPPVEVQIVLPVESPNDFLVQAAPRRLGRRGGLDDEYGERERVKRRPGHRRLLLLLLPLLLLRLLLRLL